MKREQEWVSHFTRTLLSQGSLARFARSPAIENFGQEVIVQYRVAADREDLRNLDHCVESSEGGQRQGSLHEADLLTVELVRFALRG